MHIILVPRAAAGHLIPSTKGLRTNATQPHLQQRPEIRCRAHFALLPVDGQASATPKVTPVSSRLSVKLSAPGFQRPLNAATASATATATVTASQPEVSTFSLATSEASDEVCSFALETPLALSGHAL